MGSSDSTKQVALFALLVVVVAAGVIFWSVYNRATSDENHDALRMVQAFFNTVATGKTENGWASIAISTQEAGSLDALRERTDSHPAFHDIEGYAFTVDEPTEGSARIDGTVSTGAGEFEVLATCVQEGTKWRLASLTVDETVILP